MKLLIIHLITFCCYLVNITTASTIEINNQHDSSSKTSVRTALIVTIAGDHKLAEYFEWSCITIDFSKDAYDMLVFHESNSKLMTLNCAKNVKFIDLGTDGLSKILINKLFQYESENSNIKAKLTKILSDIILHMPRYLVEVKPMFGTLFDEYLKSYSHWSYTDPDIIWGNLTNWIDTSDLQSFDILTLTKNMDAGRLFLRGQLTIHKNILRNNELWKDLEYFKPSNYAERLGN